MAIPVIMETGAIQPVSSPGIHATRAEFFFHGNSLVAQMVMPLRAMVPFVPPENNRVVASGSIVIRFEG